MYAQDNNSLPVWFILSPAYHHISINSQPFLVGIVSHMNRLKRIHRTDQPDYSFLPQQDFDWTYSVYGDVHNILPDDMPEPLGKAVVTTTTMDDNLNHCLTTGKSLTGCLHFVNKKPVDWYSKKQATVETATYGSEFVAAKQEQKRSWTSGRL